MKDINIENEVWYTTVRSGGKGGQHVNKVETKVHVWFNLGLTTLFNPGEKERIKASLSLNVSREGLINISYQNSRSQFKNKKAALNLLQEKIAKALVIPKKRKPVSIPNSVLRKRKKNKEIKSQKKALRGNLSAEISSYLGE